MAERARAPKPGANDADKEQIEQITKGKGRGRKKAEAKNAGPVSDETVGMHINLIKEAEARWRELRDQATQAQGVLRNRYKVAKSDGVDTDSLKKALSIAERGTGEVMAEQRNIGRYLRIMGAPIGHQWTLFEDAEDPAVQELDATAQGEQAGLNGEPSSNCPFKAGTEQAFSWRNGWQIGADKLTDSFKTGRKPEAGAPAH